jgi:hypothetical protein
MSRKGNNYKVKRKTKSPGGTLFKVIEGWLNLDNFSIIQISGAYLPQVLFLMAIGILYIGNGHYAENTLRKISTVQKEMEDLRADYLTLKADYMFDSKQSEVAAKVKKQGLLESSEPPLKIIAEQ